MSYDLPERFEERLPMVLLDFPNVEKVILFGSRARGDNKYNSDIDIALIGENIRPGLNTRIREAAGLYSVDIVNFDSVDNPDLTEEILKDGIVIYENLKKERG